jgi:hypothetical protein
MLLSAFPTLAKANSIVPFLLNESKHISIHCLSIFHSYFRKLSEHMAIQSCINDVETKDELPPDLSGG